MQLQLLLCILPQALPGINALKNLNLLTLECTVWNQFTIEEEKKTPTFYLIVPYYILVGQSLISCFSQGKPQKGILVKDPEQKNSPFKGKKSLTLCCKLNCSLLKSICLTARKVLWVAELRPTPPISQVQLVTLETWIPTTTNRLWSTQMFTEHQHQLPY